MTDTIFALSSGAGRAGIAVIRCSGPRARFALETIVGPLPTARRAVHRSFRAADGAVLDDGLALWLPGPGTATGEDMCELQCHGSAAVVAALLGRLASIDGLRPARAGEFTRRALFNGRMDLTAVEGLADLLAAETDAQLRQARRLMEGALRDAGDDWRARIVGLQARIEAAIDFSDEGDVGDDLGPSTMGDIAGLARDLRTALAGGKAGECIRDGVTVAILGPANVGKSSLLNALARRDVAIVSAEPGTTRDPVEVRMELAGVPVTFVDTAGLRETDAPVEREGVRRALARAERADLVIGMAAPDVEIRPLPVAVPTIRVENKCDLGGCALDSEAFRLSALTGEGLPALESALNDRVRALVAAPDGSVTMSRLRQRDEIGRAADALDRAARAGAGVGLDVVAEELRLASAALGRLTGRIDVEDVLDALFAEFCIGK